MKKEVVIKPMIMPMISQYCAVLKRSINKEYEIMIIPMCEIFLFGIIYTCIQIPNNLDSNLQSHMQCDIQYTTSATCSRIAIIIYFGDILFSFFCLQY